MGLTRFLVLMGAVTSIVFLLSGNSFSQEKNEVSAIEVSEPQPAAVIIGEESNYTLGQGDIIEIAVRNQPEFSGQFIVGPDGNIQYKFVGDIKAEGLAKSRLKEVLITKLEQFVKVPEVSVMILAYQSKFVYVLGEVRSPGKYPMKGDTVSLRETLIAAGLPTPSAALRRTYVITPNEKKPLYKKIDIFKLLYKGVLKDNLTLAHGDLVVVPSTVPSEINRALSNLLSPFSQAADSRALYEQLTP